MSIENGCYEVGVETLRVRPWRETSRQLVEYFAGAGASAGKVRQSRFIKLAIVDGGERGTSFLGFQPAQDALSVLLASSEERQEAFGTSFARRTGKCWRCGRELTDPVSVEMGVGPVCVGKSA